MRLIQANYMLLQDRIEITQQQEFPLRKTNQPTNFLNNSIANAIAENLNNLSISICYTDLNTNCLCLFLNEELKILNFEPFWHFDNAVRKQFTFNENFTPLRSEIISHGISRKSAPGGQTIKLRSILFAR